MNLQLSMMQEKCSEYLSDTQKQHIRASSMQQKDLKKQGKLKMEENPFYT